MFFSNKNKKGAKILQVILPYGTRFRKTSVFQSYYSFSNYLCSRIYGFLRLSKISLRKFQKQELNRDLSFYSTCISPILKFPYFPSSFHGKLQWSRKAIQNQTSQQWTIFQFFIMENVNLGGDLLINNRVSDRDKLEFQYLSIDLNGQERGH